MIPTSTKLSFEKITDKIFHIHFDKQLSLTSTFLRFQELYESPHFKDKIFTLREFKDWYKKETGNKKFTYYYDWDGFNLPSTMLEPFYNGKFDPLTKNEKRLLKTFEAYRSKPFCIVGTYGDCCEATLMHEIAHGLWSTEIKYRLRAKKALKGLSKSNNRKLEKMLKESIYHPSVWDDEKHAYILANSYFLAWEYGIKGSDVLRVRDKLTFLYNLYMHLNDRKERAG